MWRFRNRTLYLGLDASSAAWYAPAHEGSAAWADAADPGRLILGSGREGAFSRAEVVVAGTAARHWLQAAPAGLRSLRELRDFVTSRAEQLFGGQGWQVAADWQTHRAFLCAALPAAVVAAGASLAGLPGVRCRFSTTLSRALATARVPIPPWLALHEPGMVHVLWSDPHGIVAYQAIPVAEGCTPEEATALAQSEAIQLAALRGVAFTGPLKLQPLAPRGHRVGAQAALAVARGALQEAA